jgi:KipI family sensor histidine kinase inhibitor
MRTSDPSRITPASDRALLVSFEGGVEAALHPGVARLTAKLLARRDARITNVHPAYASVLVCFDAAKSSAHEIGAILAEIMTRDTSNAEASVPGREVEIPVCYDAEFGPDLGTVASLHDLTPSQVVRLHTEPEYQVCFLGFTPGFAYLGGLPARLASPRLAVPRVRVPAGSVAIGGAQTGVYPIVTPGGWQLLGRTPLRLFDAAREAPATLRMGDRVRFRCIDRHEFDATVEASLQPARIAEPRRASIDARLIVEAPGLLSTIQDLGRFGSAHLGVSASGAADALALRIGNLLAGNERNAAAIEMTLVGGSFRFLRDTWFVLAGADFGAALDGRPISPWRPCRARAGEVLKAGAAKSGARCYLCVQGGFDLPLVLGSASTHVGSGLGGRRLQSGDTLAVRLAGSVSPPARAADSDWIRHCYDNVPLRITPGPQLDHFAPGMAERLTGTPYAVLEQSDRMGVRLQGAPLERLASGDLVTEGAALGSIQIDGSGQPIVLFVEHQTTGGYPKIAAVCSADIHRVGQLRPRDLVRFEWVSFEAARAALVQCERELDALAGGR